MQLLGLEEPRLQYHEVQMRSGILLFLWRNRLPSRLLQQLWCQKEVTQMISPSLKILSFPLKFYPN